MTSETENAGATALEQYLDSRKDELIDLIEASFGVDANQTAIKPARSALRNLLDLALSTNSLKEVELFIRYQIGRYPDDWRDFGNRLIELFPSVAPANRPPPERIAVLRLFMGYLVRYDRYLNPGKRN